MDYVNKCNFRYTFLCCSEYNEADYEILRNRTQTNNNNKKKIKYMQSATRNFALFSPNMNCVLNTV